MTATLTKKAIKEAFIKLLDEQPVNKISVKDIVEECGINRNSFYYHFQDVPDLIEEILTEQIDMVVEKYADTESLDEFFEEAIRLITKNKKALYHTYQSPNRERFEQMLMKTCEYIVSSYLDKKFAAAEINEEDRALMIRFVACSSFGICIGWLMRGMKDDLLADIRRLLEISNGAPFGLPDA